jgi:hypothetical protein
MIRLLGASALALTLTTPAAHAAYRHHHGAYAGYGRYHQVRHYYSARRRYTFGPNTAYRRDSFHEDAPYSHEAFHAEPPYRRDARQESVDRRGTYAMADRHADVGQTHVSGGRPRAWCGWYARSLVGQDPGPEFNLARNWARWGHSAGPGVGVMVVWPHHVGMITGRTPDGQWIVKSGNDGGGAVRERPRSISGAIAFRAS